MELDSIQLVVIKHQRITTQIFICRNHDPVKEIHSTLMLWLSTDRQHLHYIPCCHKHEPPIH